MSVHPLVRRTFANPLSAAYLGLVGSAVAFEVIAATVSDPGIVGVWPFLFTAPTSLGAAGVVGAVWGIDAPYWLLGAGVAAGALLQSFALGHGPGDLPRTPPMTFPDGQGHTADRDPPQHAAPRSAMTTTKGPASYFPSIEKKYGQPISHWQDLIDASPLTRHMELVNWLKSEHGLGHGHANALVAHTLTQAGQD